MGRILSINDERVMCLRSLLPWARIPRTLWHLTLPQRNHGLSHITTVGSGAGGALPILLSGTRGVFESEALFRYFIPCRFAAGIYDLVTVSRFEKVFERELKTF